MLKLDPETRLRIQQDKHEFMHFIAVTRIETRPDK
jgi:hypothetical protein